MPEEKMLACYRVLDLTDEKGFLCGKILGDLGADVLKVEKPGGDPARRLGPFFHEEPHPEQSLYWMAYNNNKRGLTLNLETRTGQDLFVRLARTADVVIESFAPGYLNQLGIGYSALAALEPGLIMTSLTPFGQSGPYSQYRASDLEMLAMSGLMSLLGQPEHPPVRVTLPQSYLWAGMFAAAATLMALYYRGVSGEGQRVDISGQAAVIPALAHAPTFWDVLGENPRREGIYMTGRSVTGARMRCIYPCKDGYLNFIIYGGPAGRATNKALAQWMAEAGMAPEYFLNKDWDSFDIATVTQEEIDLLEAPIAEFLKTRTKAEFLEQAVKRRMLGYPVATAEDILKDPQLQARGFWQEIEHPELGGTLTYPGGFARFSAATCRVWRRAPRIGEHNAEIYGELGISREEQVQLMQAGVI